MALEDNKRQGVGRFLRQWQRRSRGKPLVRHRTDRRVDAAAGAEHQVNGRFSIDKSPFLAYAVSTFHHHHHPHISIKQPLVRDSTQSTVFSAWIQRGSPLKPTNSLSFNLTSSSYQCRCRDLISCHLERRQHTHNP